MKKISTSLILLSFVTLLLSNVKSTKFSSQPPTGYTGASGDYCVQCHSSFALNTAGGSVSVSGLPNSNYVPNQAYPFTLTISHASANRNRWGFSIASTTTGNNAIGTFSSTNANAANNSDELSHNGAVVTSTQASYTYTNLTWTAPATANQPVTFYFVGNAANNANGNQGDYIYSSTKVVALPIELAELIAKVNGKDVLINWKTSTEINSNYFEVEKSDNGQIFYSIAKIAAAGNTSSSQSYSFTDSKPSYYERSIFYRLKMVDKDGTLKYSKVIDVKLKANSLFVKRVFPTYLTVGSTVKTEIVSNKNATVNLVLFSSTGKILQVQNASITLGNNTLSLVIPNTTSRGIVYLKVIASDMIQTIPISIQ